METFVWGSQGKGETFVLFNISVNYPKINPKFADDIRTGEWHAQRKASGFPGLAKILAEWGCSIKLCFHTGR